jgi:D-alanine--poly(phosphoribitol) ligase subunit 1
MNTNDPIGRFLGVARARPDHPAVDLGDDIVTYAGLEDRARRLATVFASVEAPRVLIALPRGPDAYAAMIGALLSGGCYIPVNVAAPIAKLVQLAELIRPNVIVADAARANEIAKTIPTPLIVDPTHASEAAPLQGPGRRSSTAYVILTSGSTGSPKGVVVSTPAFAHYMDWVSNSGIFRGDDRVSQFPDISFDLSVLDIFGALNAGATLAPATKAGDRLFPADFARRSAISVWVSVPSAIGLVMKGGQATPAMLGAIRLFIFCGEALRPAHLASIFQARPDVTVMNLYGPTEATVSMTSVLLRSPDYQEACADSATLGDPIDDMGLHLVGGAHPDEGQIVITGPQLATEYWFDPERTAKAFRSLSIGGRAVRGYFTGDWAERRGKRLFFKGRIDTQVKINGYRIETGEIIARLADCGWPVACVLKHNELLVAVVESADGRPLDAQALRAQLHTRLEAHAVPAYIHSIERMPLNNNDKLDEEAVRRWLDHRSGAAAPRS